MGAKVASQSNLGTEPSVTAGAENKGCQNGINGAGLFGPGSMIGSSSSFFLHTAWRLVADRVAPAGWVGPVRSSQQSRSTLKAIVGPLEHL